MDNKKLLKLEPSALTAEEYFLPAEKLLAGNPKQLLWNHYSDPGGRFFTGIWQSEVGKWRINYTEDEYCELLEGISIITDASGQATRVCAGERFVIPSGFSGSWEVLERTRKVYVIHEPTA